ncbi:MAG: hypothetical protein ABW193_09935 [Luteibacter sp.]
MALSLRHIRLSALCSFAAMAMGTLLPPASAANEAPLKIEWPANGIAQRMFPDGSTMFVETDRGTLRAWVMSETHGGAKVEAMDFFSGERRKVKVELEDDGRPSQGFTDDKGVAHVGMGQPFAYSRGSGFAAELPGLDLSAGTIFVKPSGAYCGSRFIATATTQGAGGEWRKVAIYHSGVGSPSCPHGGYWANITSALDLGDGTFLAVQDCFVFRLRKSDLSPVGAAPALRVVDKAVLEQAIDKAKSNGSNDTMDDVARSLNLPTSPDLSCTAQR